MKRQVLTNKQPLLVITAIILLVMMMLPFLSANAGEKPFPHIVPALTGSLPEGFAIGRGHTAFNGSVDGSIYKVDLRSGKGEVLINPEVDPGCYKLGMRVDPRTNYLFVAGCEGGNAYVFDADNGALVREYQLPTPAGGFQIVNDLAITKDAVYFTDSHQPLLYRLPLSRNGGLPDIDAATFIELGGDFDKTPPADGCCGANGIVATPNGKTLIIGHSNNVQLYRVDPTTGYADEIIVDLDPLGYFLDGIALRDNTLYIMEPALESVQVVRLGEDMLTGEFLGSITDLGMDGVASGAFFGNSLYVNNARYSAPPGSEQWITKLDIRTVK